METVVASERLTLRKAADQVGVHPGTVWRWALHGVRGRRLRTFTVGGRRYVRTADLTDFLSQTPPQATSGSTSSSKRADTAGAKLDALGVTPLPQKAVAND